MKLSLLKKIKKFTPKRLWYKLSFRELKKQNHYLKKERKRLQKERGRLILELDGLYHKLTSLIKG